MIEPPRGPWVPPNGADRWGIDHFVRPVGPYVARLAPVFPGTCYGLFAFRWRRVDTPPPPGWSIERRHLHVTVPCWAVAATFLMWPGVRVFRWRRSRRVLPPGVCVACGYDLRGNPVGDRCPECGTVVAVSDAPDVAAVRTGLPRA